MKAHPAFVRLGAGVPLSRDGSVGQKKTAIKAVSIDPRIHSLLLALGLLCSVSASARAAVVSECTETALREAMAGGGRVTFAGDGTILLANTITNAVDTSLDAAGHRITISGGGLVSMFHIGSNILFSAANLTLSNGLSYTAGGAIYNDGGTVNLTNCTFVRNRAGAPAPIYSADLDGAEGRGGAVFNAGRLFANRCAFIGNSATGWVGGQTVVTNLVTYPPTSSGGLPGGRGLGGAVYSVGSLAIDRCLFVSNAVAGGMGGYGGPGMYNWIQPSASPGGTGGAGGEARGGAIYGSGSITIVASALAYNLAGGGEGGNGGSGFSMGVGPIIYSNGGNGGGGGGAYGAGLFLNGTGSVANCTLALNRSGGGSGGNGGTGGWASDHGYTFHGSDGSPGASGGGFAAAAVTDNGTTGWTNCTVAFNSGTAGAALSGSGTVLANTILAGNIPTNGYATILDGGHNLSSDASCAFTHPASLNNTDARLLTLADNGGDTLTIALQPDSPAIDAGDDLLVPRTDQRGIGRLFGSVSDIGAFECDTRLVLHAAAGTGATIDLKAETAPGQAFRLWVSTNLLDWSPIQTNQVDATGLLHLQTDAGLHQRFYRAEPFLAPGGYTVQAIASPPAAGWISGGGRFLQGCRVALVAHPAAAYSFLEWTENGTTLSADSVYTFSATANRTLTANFAPLYTISLAASPASAGAVSGAGVFLSGSSVTVVGIASPGYGFVSWQEQGVPVSSNASYSFTATANRSLTANFAPLYTIDVQAAPADGGSVSGGGVFLIGSTDTVTAVTNQGYRFVNWTENGIALSRSASYTLIAYTNHALIANFVPLQTVTVQASPASAGTASGGAFAVGSAATVIAMPGAGYAFLNWTENGIPVSTSARYSFVMANDRELTANFAPACALTLSAAPEHGGLVAGEGVFARGSVVTASAIAIPGYAFVNWVENGLPISVSSNYSITLTNNRELQANFQPLYPAQIVSECTDAALRSAMAGGGTISFACDGIINLTNVILVTNDTVLDATGHLITFAGPGQFTTQVSGRGVYVSSNVTFTAIHLTFSNFFGSDFASVITSGGAIVNDGGKVSLIADAFVGNQAVAGGAVFNTGQGVLRAWDCTFSANAGIALEGVWARGGALCSDSGQVGLKNCVFRDNILRCYGTVFIAGAPWVQGGAIFNGGQMDVDVCAFQANQCSGAAMYVGGAGGEAQGGAIWNAGTLVLSRSVFLNNRVAGGDGGVGAPGAGPGMAGGAGGNGGSGLGGALLNSGIASAVNCLFAGNSCSGGQGGRGGQGGMIDPWHFGPPGPDGQRGVGAGAVYDTTGHLSLTNCTLAFNTATISAAGLQTGGGVLVNTLLATNSPGNASGLIVDGGHNLSSDGSCSFTNFSSMNATAPQVAQISSDGGPFVTVPLLAGSPAIDAGDTLASPPTDQRGFPRPYGTAADIGAYEAMPLDTVSLSAAPVEGASVSGGGLVARGATVTVVATLSAGYKFVNWTENGTVVATSPRFTFIVTGSRALTANTIHN